MVLGKDDSQGAQEGAGPGWGPPAQLRRMAPPDVELAQGEAGNRAGPGEAPKETCDDDVWNGAQKAIEQDRRIGRQHGVIEVRAPAVVMRA